MYATGEHFLANWDPAAGACVVIDVRMPGMSGLELQEQLLLRGHAVPIIFVTGHGDIPTAVSAIKKGAVDFIEKPFNDREFLQVIDKAVRTKGPSFQERTKQLAAATRIATLSQREHEVMRLVIAGSGAHSVADLVQLVLDAKIAR
jgi:FixJ family two-component response regulator